MKVGKKIKQARSSNSTQRKGKEQTNKQTRRTRTKIQTQIIKIFFLLFEK